jgi:hypothetical protein
MYTLKNLIIFSLLMFSINVAAFECTGGGSVYFSSNTAARSACMTAAAVNGTSCGLPPNEHGRVTTCGLAFDPKTSFTVLLYPVPGYPYLDPTNNQYLSEDPNLVEEGDENDTGTAVVVGPIANCNTANTSSCTAPNYAGGYVETLSSGSCATYCNKVYDIDSDLPVGSERAITLDFDDYSIYSDADENGVITITDPNGSVWELVEGRRDGDSPTMEHIFRKTDLTDTPPNYGDEGSPTAPIGPDGHKTFSDQSKEPDQYVIGTKSQTSSEVNGPISTTTQTTTDTNLAGGTNTTETKTSTDSGTGNTTTKVKTSNTNSRGVGSSSTTTTVTDSSGIVVSTGITASESNEGTDTNSKSRVTGDSTCEAPPFCSGDEALCEIIKQNWLVRCKPIDVEYIDESLATSLSDISKAQFATDMNSFGDAYTLEVIEVADTSGLVQAVQDLADKFDGIFDVGACANLEIVYKGHPLTITCEDTESLREILGWAAWVLTFMGVWNMTAGPKNKKAGC